VPAHFHEDFKSCYTELIDRRYGLYMVEPADGEDLARVKMPEKSAFIFGNEELGHSFNIDDYSEILLLKIPQFGKVESLNVSIAASVVMYEYVKQHHRG
jgi:tRNA G18 (ribose-2'-O)-methylase SpoU